MHGHISGMRRMNLWRSTYYKNYPNKLTIGLLYSGFDDSNAGWSGDKVISQQCGQVLLFTANEVTKGNFWGATHQIPYMMMATWNDYEEGTEQESGIDNCYTDVTLSKADRQHYHLDIKV